MSFSTGPGYRPGSYWQVERHSDQLRYSRRLGTLEQRFNISGSRGGQSDTFVQLRLGLDSPKPEDRLTFYSRLLLAWTRCRAKHPLLASTVHEHTSSTIPGCPGRKIIYQPPKSSSDALRLAQQSILSARGKNLDERLDEIRIKYVLNGDRVLLAESSCLARLVIVEGENSSNEIGFFLVISHTISDGLSVLKLLNELFTAAASPEFPSAPVLDAPPFLDFDSFISGRTSTEPYHLSEGLHESWRTTLLESEILSALPLATEDHLPSLPLSPTPPNPSVQPTEGPIDPHATPSHTKAPSTSARKRWIWAIARTITLARQRRSPRTLPFPRLVPSSPTPPIRTRWEIVKFDEETTASLFRFCKLNGQSPSMLLYSLLSIATANLLASLHPPDPSQYFPILIGFPFSARPILERVPQALSDPSSDLAIRLTFTSVALPNLPLSLDKSNSEAVRQAVLRGARLAKSQLSKRLAVDTVHRTVLLSEIDAVNTDRLLLRFEQPRPPWEAPHTCINGSMIGDIDRMLRRDFTFTSEGFSLNLSNLEIGVRLHAGEGMFYEGFTFDGCLQLSGGYDEELIDPRHFWAILNGVKEVGTLVAEAQRQQEGTSV